jgi:hypothetical protein
VLEDHRKRGCRSCRHRDLEVVAVGSGGAFASLTWELIGADRSIVTSWRESYNLVRSGARWRICASMDHAT